MGKQLTPRRITPSGIVAASLVLAVVLTGTCAPARAAPRRGSTVRYTTPDASVLSSQARRAIATALSRPERTPRASHYYVVSIRWERSWAIATVTPTNPERRLRAGEESALDIAHMVNLLLVRAGGRWRAALQGDARIRKLLERVPRRSLGRRARAVVFGLHGESGPHLSAAEAAQQYSNYLLPWPAKQNGSPFPWEVRQGWHDCACFGFPQYHGIDFGPKNHGNSDILAAAPGVVQSMCRGSGGEAELNIVTDGTSEKLGYLHLNLSSVDGRGIGTGSHVNKGQVLGYMWSVVGGDSCGKSSGTHLHMYFPTRPFTIDGLAFTDGNYHWGETLYSSQGTAVPIHTATALIPHAGSSGYAVDGYGHLHPFGGAPPVTSAPPTWPNWDIARAVAIAPGSTKTSVTGYVLDGFGGIHPFGAGGAHAPPAVDRYSYWSGWDIARAVVLSTPTSGYVLDGWGGIHPFASAGEKLPTAIAVGPYWKNWDIARGLVLSTPGSGYVLDGFGGIHPFAAAGTKAPPAPAVAAYWKNWDIARSITLATPTTGYVLDGYGGVHPFAPAGVAVPPGPSTPYKPGSDVFRAVAFDPASGGGVTVERHMSDGTAGDVHPFTGPATQAHSALALIPNDGASGYALDGYGHLRPFGNAPPVTAAPPTWPKWDIARAIAIAPNSTRSSVRGYVLDGWGGIHSFAAGGASRPPAPYKPPYWPNWDIARAIVLSSPSAGYVLDGYGGIHPFGPQGADLPAAPYKPPYWPNWDIARSIALATPSTGYLLDGYGGVHPFGPQGAAPPAIDRLAYWPNWDIARALTLATSKSGYVLDGYGGIHPFAAAGEKLPPATASPGYLPGWDVFDAIALDPVSGAGIDSTAAYVDGSGHALYRFRGPAAGRRMQLGGRPRPPAPACSIRALSNHVHRSGRAHHRHGSLPLRVSCTQTVLATLTGRISGGGGKLAVAPIGFAVAEGRPKTVNARLPAHTLKLLRNGVPLAATFRLRATDENGVAKAKTKIAALQ